MGMELKRKAGTSAKTTGIRGLSWRLMNEPGAVIILGVGLVLATACSRSTPSNSAPHPKQSLTVRNDSTNRLDWAQVRWGERVLEVGVLSPGKGATFLDAGPPVGVTTNIAVIEFINEDAPGLNWESGSNEEVRTRREKSWTHVPVDVSGLLRLGPGGEITFRILSLTNADVLVDGEKIQ